MNDFNHINAELERHELWITKLGCMTTFLLIAVISLGFGIWQTERSRAVSPCHNEVQR